MCGRFTLTSSPEELARRFGLAEAPSTTARYNIAPGQEVLIVRTAEDDRTRESACVRWGLVPPWAEDPGVGVRMINARSETAASKPAFREAFRRRRCLVPADGFYEWIRDANTSQAYHIHALDRRLLAFAGLWERRRREEQLLESCTILTTEACEPIRHLHPRMPVVLPPEAYGTWLDPDLDEPERLEALLVPLRFVDLAHHPVSPRVNSPRFDDPACAEPAPEAPAQGSLF